MITDPAKANIWPPIPKIYPSSLPSIALEVIELANPVVGINNPAPHNLPKCLYKPRRVSIDVIKTIKIYWFTLHIVLKWFIDIKIRILLEVF